MISKQSLSVDRFKEISNKNRKTDPILIEKTIHALILLEQLKVNDLDFIFKGGTSLILLLDGLKRLSIDIDIIIPEKTDVTPLLDTIIGSSDFTRWELHERKAKSKIDKAHYKIYYQPLANARGREEYILLDILFESNPYGQWISEKEIKSDLLLTEGEPVHVSVPIIDAILGDKLTAFAPNTTGIPYRIKKEVEIIKQMYDVGNLVDVATDVSIINEIFSRISEKELDYRGLNQLSQSDILEDIFQTALCISLRGQGGAGRYDELLKGIKNIVNFINSEPFHLERAITFASKAAYISTVLKTQQKEIQKFHSPEEIKDWKIIEPAYSKLNKLKKSNPEAFFYWYLATKTK